MMQPTLERSTTPAPTSLIIGTGDSRHGLYRVDFDPITGAFGQVAPALPEPDLNFVVADPIHHRLYAVGEGPAKVLALAVDPATGAITELNRQAVSQWTFRSKLYFEQFFCFVEGLLVTIRVVHQTPKHALDGGLSKQWNLLG